MYSYIHFANVNIIYLLYVLAVGAITAFYILPIIFPEIRRAVIRNRKAMNTIAMIFISFIDVHSGAVCHSVARLIGSIGYRLIVLHRFYSNLGDFIIYNNGTVGLLILKNLSENIGTNCIFMLCYYPYGFFVTVGSCLLLKLLLLGTELFHHHRYLTQIHHLIVPGGLDHF